MTLEELVREHSKPIRIELEYDGENAYATETLLVHEMNSPLCEPIADPVLELYFEKPLRPAASVAHLTPSSRNLSSSKSV
jgi:hypothetical protein